MDWSMAEVSLGCLFELLSSQDHGEGVAWRERSKFGADGVSVAGRLEGVELDL